ncbi:small acid-soluble spore protein O [Halalkalibacter alkalisediminis]|uniref:Small acid-soluble spore protein O n=1 Tax=Halalkalibacter alkalisediminis TaxID=935616 RepID=A0ABV6NID0_9BACI|nr:small acid-soluble spore protein O [Halalkalibacter alkalisediminis]
MAKQRSHEKDKRVLEGEQFQEGTVNEPLTEMERQHNKKTKKRQ